jgi:hypothetical protein
VKEKCVRIVDLVGEKQADTFNAILPTLDIVAKEEISGIRWVFELIEVAEKVVELTVDAPENNDRRSELKSPWIREKNVFDRGEKLESFGFHDTGGRSERLRCYTQRFQNHAGDSIRHERRYVFIDRVQIIVRLYSNPRSIQPHSLFGPVFANSPDNSALCSNQRLPVDLSPSEKFPQD